MGTSVTPVTSEKPPASMRRKVLVNFGLFAIFFVFYMGAAIIQTPHYEDIAVQQFMGMPLGLLVSLCVFPVSWIIIIIWYWKAR
ncbi:MAG: hypothetical protein JXL81_00915 [Deltaproteobacteria bacterium]|nr:hypothetical protein [Deltaproteobacteria bacterium]